MNQKYEITWCELKKEGETNGRKWKITNMTLKDEQGNVINDVSTFDDVMPGHTILGSIEMKGQYKNFKKALEKPNFMKAKEASIEKAVARKEESIGKFQDSKDWSIRTSSTMRDAVLLAIAEQDPTPQNIQKWRKWLLDNWELDIKDINPF